MDGGRSPPTRKHRRARRRTRDLFYSDPAFATKSLRMDEHRAWKRSESRFQARLLESEFLHSSSSVLFRLLHYCFPITAPLFGPARQGRQPAVHHSSAQARVRPSPVACALADL